MNVVQWISQTSDALEKAEVYFGHGTDNAHDEAAWLVLHVLAAPVDGSFDDWNRELTRAEAEQLEHLLQARITQKIPLAYLTGTTRFAGLEFAAARGALVPRSPLAELVMQQFRPWIEPKELVRVLDMCTGSACIAIAVAHYLPWTTVDAVDVSPEALEVAATNIKRHEMQQRVRLIQSDLFHSLPPCPYDLIITNPPYVPGASIADLPDEYLAEPALGLASGTDGLDATLAIIAAAVDYLSPDGILLCEVGESEHSLQALLPGLPFLWLEFANGGEGVFLLTKRELEACNPAVTEILEERSHVA